MVGVEDVWVVVDEVGMGFGVDLFVEGVDFLLY